MLEAHDEPRSRLMEADTLIGCFENFLSNDMENNTLRTGEPSAHAENILKLDAATTELLPGRYEDVKQRLSVEYIKVEQHILDELSAAQRQNDSNKMREIVLLTGNFRAYQSVVDRFVVNIQRKAFKNPDIFQDILPLMERAAVLIDQVFPRPDFVVGKLVDCLMNCRLKNYIRDQLPAASSSQISTRHLFLTRMAQLFSKTRNLCEALASFHMDTSTRNSLHTVPGSLFEPYLKTYRILENECMRFRLEIIIQAYYQSIGHQKKNAIPLPLRGVRREIQSKMNSRVASFINVAPAAKDSSEETLICEMLAVNSLQELRESASRIMALLSGAERSHLLTAVFQTFISKFVQDHLIYGIRQEIKTIPVNQAITSEPKYSFLRSVHQTNAIFHLIENVFYEEFLPLIEIPSLKHEAIKQKMRLQRSLEETICTGLGRSIKAYVRWIEILLEKQRCSEYLMHQTTRTAVSVLDYTAKCNRAFDEYLDGVNKENAHTEFGCKLLRVIYLSTRRFTYSQEEGIGLLCDVNEYRNLMSSSSSKTVQNSFSILQTLCGLLIVPAENLSEILSSDSLKDINSSTKKQFVSLRRDFKTNKLSAILFPGRSL